mgnify:CR=1 FL=1
MLLPLILASADLYVPPSGELSVFVRWRGATAGRHRFHVMAWQADGRLVGVFRDFEVQEIA